MLPRAILYLANFCGQQSQSTFHTQKKLSVDLNELNDGHLRVVALARHSTKHATVATVAVTVALGRVLEEEMHELLVIDVAHGLKIKDMGSRLPIEHYTTASRPMEFNDTASKGNEVAGRGAGTFAQRALCSPGGGRGGRHAC